MNRFRRLLSRVGGLLRQEDYWAYDDERLEQLAKRYRIPTWGRADDGKTAVFLRNEAIRALTERDDARRAPVLNGLLAVVAVLGLGFAAWQARTAQVATDAAIGALELQSSSARLEQRAWVSVKSLVLSAEPDGVAQPTVLLTLSNTGQTPAIGLTSRSSSGTISLGDEHEAIDWTKISADNPIVLFPNTEIGAFVGFVPIAPGPALTAYRSGVKKMTIRIRLEYQDVFAQPHHTETCYTHVFGDALTTFDPCRRWHSIDLPGK